MRVPTDVRRAACTVCSLFLLTLAVAEPARALTPRTADPLDEKAIPPRRYRAFPEAAPVGSSGAAAAMAGAFRGRHPGEWEMTFDRGTGRAWLVSGRGIPFLPGGGNLLTPGALGLSSAPPSPAEAEKLGRAFIDSEAAILRPDVGELKLNPGRSGSFDGGDLWYLDFDWVVGGVPVEGARVFLRVNHGNLVQFGTHQIGRLLGPPTATLDADEALARAFAHAGGRFEEDRTVNAGELVVVPFPLGASPVPWGGGIDYRLVWRVAFRRASRHSTWTAEVDARSGQVLAFYDANRYARVTGGVHQRTVNDPEQERPFTRVRVTQGLSRIDTGDAGTYTYLGGAAFTALDGPFFRPVCIDCQSPERGFALALSGTGDLRLGTGGVDALGNGASTPAERNSFFHLNRIRALAKKWLANAWLETTVEANVNIQDVCNAFWDGTTVNFFRSGSGCNNTAQNADVVYHEWGHGLDQNTNLGDGSTGEATGDITSMHLTHDGLMGPYFDVNGGAVRDLESSRVGYVARISNLDSFCVDCSAQGLNCTDGPGGHEVHCEGEIYGQASWDLAKLLVAKHGANTGWQTSERLYFLSLPQVDTFFPGQPQNAYGAYLAVDDDNGNLADGTPNCVEIYNAFNAHEIAGTPCAANSPACSRPAQPVVTATPACDRVVLDWPSVPGATQYRVLRTDFSPGGAYLPLATQSTTHYEDATVQPGLAYYYVVESQNAAGCRSTVEGGPAASLTAAARLDLAGVSVDDLPAGNRSGFADPGESIDPTVTLLNARPADAAPAASGTLSTTTSGVSVTVPGSSYGAVGAGATSSGTAYRAAISSAVACGVNAQFSLQVSDGGSCPASPASFPVLIGQRIPRFTDDFETDQGWTLGSGTAITGAWVRGDPAGTNWQPEFDATPSGTRCFFTAQNATDSDGDVDGGVTVLLSPVINLSGAAAARLSYLRWWANSAPGADAGDFFAVDVSSNSGSSWVNVETLNGNQRALGWHPVEVRLESLIALNNQFRIRIRAQDGTPTGALVEAALDDVAVEEVVCDLTPPCFVPPTFEGLGSVGPGASCAEADLSWSPASSNCANAQIRYNVYRSTTPGFTPSASNRIAAGLTSAVFHDTLLTPGVQYHYAVRADDSRSGEDSNNVQLPVTAASSPDTVSPVFAGLASAVTGPNCGETILSWSAAAETCSPPARYDVFRSTTPGFSPGPSNRVASTLSTAYIDTALVPDQTYHYVVRAVDSAGNSDPNLAERSATSRILPRLVYQQDFEGSNGGWGTIAPNDAATGLWEWGDPEGAGVQPEDDHTPAPGVKAWITGLAALGGIGGNDVDAGTTTLASPNLDVSSASSPVLEMAVFFSNDVGANPGEDPFRVDVSDNAGSTWVQALNTTTPIPDWDLRQFPLAGLISFNNQFRIRVTATDLGVGGSVVEAGVDDVKILQPGEGCGGCPAPTPPVGNITLDRSGDDIVIDWSSHPVLAASYNVYLMSGPTFAQAVRAGNTSTKVFTHPGAALLTGENFFYRVSAVDTCGVESALQ